MHTLFHLFQSLINSHSEPSPHFLYYFVTRQIAAFLINIFRGLPLIVVPIHFVYDDSAATTFESSVKVALLIFLIIHIVLALIAIIDTGATEPRWWERMAR